MSGSNEDDKPTVILDLNALKKQKLKQEEDLANLASELEFNVSPEVTPVKSVPKPAGKTSEAYLNEDASEIFAEDFLEKRQEELSHLKADFPVLLFDLQSDFFEQNINDMPEGFDYRLVKTLQELNQCLKVKSFQILVLNYDLNPKAVNQLSSQIKTKFPSTKVLIMARKLSEDKVKIHSQSQAGAQGYYQLPLDPKKVEAEFLRIKSGKKKVS